MAKQDIIEFDGNKKKNKYNATAGRVAITLPGGLGSMVSGDEYKIASVPANSLILSVDLVVVDAFNGTTPTGDVEIGGTVVHNDIDLTAVGVTTNSDRRYVSEKTDVEFIPTISGATTGEVTVVVTFVEIDGYDGAFTE